VLKTAREESDLNACCRQLMSCIRFRDHCPVELPERCAPRHQNTARLPLRDVRLVR
jgi:hypothetical protein